MVGDVTDLLPSTTNALDRLAVEAQVASRTPALVAGVARRGSLVWSTAIGSASLDDPNVPLGDDTQFLVASNTKTFVAVQIMQLRDEGKLSLDDTIDQHLPSAHSGVTIRQMLSHLTGMQREPVGDVWDTLKFPSRSELIDGWNAARRVGRPHDHWHYSNLCYAMLGELIAQLDGVSWADSLQRRLLDPLGLTRTTLSLQAPHTEQYYVPHYTDVPVREPLIIKDAMASAGSICSTLSDMVRWHGFLLDPDSSILSPDTALEMRQPQAMVDGTWTAGYGLGLQLVRHEGRTWFGHTGGLPGGITGFFSEASSGTTGAVLMNNTASKDPAGVAVRLGTYVEAHDPLVPSPWVPGSVEPPQLKPLVGQWFSEGGGFILSIRDGHLEARVEGAPSTTPPSIFEQQDPDTFRTVSGREQGELLVVRRRPDGSVRQFNWATYRFTRDPLGFGEPTPT